MHRFRKRSDAKRSQLGPHLHGSTGDGGQNPFDLPLASDFRTSLILPDLSRRFSLLRDAAGDPVPLDDLRSRLAEQRARGAANYVLEEEEDMILETLHRIRSKNASQKHDDSATDTDPSTSSHRSTHADTVASSSATSSPSSRSMKRYSNNLFGSNRSRENTYIRSVRQNQRKASTTPSEVSANTNTDSPSTNRPSTPDGASSNFQESPFANRAIHSAPLNAPAPYSQPESPSFNQDPDYLGKRASHALEDAIREIEEDVEEEILMPRSPPMPRKSLDQPRPTVDTHVQEHTRNYSGMAISPDVSDVEMDYRRASPVPSRTLPGYVPGMPRPMTPRQSVETEERSLSTTPRAISPPLSSPYAPTSSVFRHESVSSAHSPRASTPSNAAPMFLQRSPSNSGRQTPETQSEITVPPVSTWRPASPASASTYQPMAVPPRAGTPSNITWSPTAKYANHSNTPSWISDNDGNMNGAYRGHARKPSLAGPSQSPALPDSPVERLNSDMTTNIIDLSSVQTATEAHFNADLGAGIMRTSTPTKRNVGSSSGSGTFHSTKDSTTRNGSARSSKQNIQNSPFSQTSFNPFVFSPIPSSSRSSLESTGSSYHSGEGTDKNSTAFLFSDGDHQQPAWHDLSSLEEPPRMTDAQAEEVVGRYSGLKHSDFFAIQNKLVSVAIAKLSSSDSRDRATSLRRRRPSTSQSTYSAVGGRDARMASPPPGAQSPIVHSPEQIAKQTALLNSVVDSVKPLTVHLSPVDTNLQVFSPPGSKSRDVSPNTRRNRDLAKVIFGGQEHAEGHQDMASSSQTTGREDFDFTSTTPMPSDATVSNSPYQLNRNPSAPRLAHTPREQEQLEREVLDKNKAAMAALKKRPSYSNLPEGLASSGSISRKKIAPQMISTPHLILATTSVDTIPITHPQQSNGQPSGGQLKLGSRLKRLRGTLRAKPNLPTGEEVTPFTLDKPSPPASQLAHYDPAKLHVPGEPAIYSATEEGRSKVVIPSPPASAGPGLKGFMARFRGNKRSADIGDPEHRMAYTPTTNLSPGVSGPNSPYYSDRFRTDQADEDHTALTTPKMAHSAPQTVRDALQEPENEDADSQSQKLKQLFDVASDLGVDQSALNDLLVRSGSTSTKSTNWTNLSRSNSAATAAAHAHSRQNSVARDPTIEEEDTAVISAASKRPPLEEPAVRKLSIHKSSAVPRPPREDGPSEQPVVLRRTLIFPSESRISTFEPSTFLKKTPSQKKRMSGQSISSRSVHDRVPTPPPPRSPHAQRFSNQGSPPVPVLPHSLSGALNSSHNDASYDAHQAHKSLALSTDNPDGSRALEVIELANGETIWSIVNGLRDDDESIYASRNSFQSDYSGKSEMQVFFKEHGRSNSKSSNASVAARKKVQPDKRPETKVFYSSPEGISHLIDQISQGMEAGSFNFLPAPKPGHSTASSVSSMSADGQYTVEQRLERMLGSLGGN